MSYENAQREYDNRHDSDDLMESTCGDCGRDFVHNCDSNNIYCNQSGKEATNVYCEECLKKHDGMCRECWESEVLKLSYSDFLVKIGIDSEAIANV